MTTAERYAKAGLPVPSMEDLEAYSLQQHEQIMGAHEVLDALKAEWNSDLVERLEKFVYEQKFRIDELVTENKRLKAQVQPMRRAS